MGFIYLIENIQSGKKYVGLTTRTTEVRWKEHLRHHREGIDIAIQKYGAKKSWLLFAVSSMSRSTLC